MQSSSINLKFDAFNLISRSRSSRTEGGDEERAGLTEANDESSRGYGAIGGGGPSDETAEQRRDRVRCAST